MKLKLKPRSTIIFVLKVYEINLAASSPSVMLPITRNLFYFDIIYTV